MRIRNLKFWDFKKITEGRGFHARGRRCRDRMVVGFTTTCESSNPTHGWVYSMQYYVIKFDSDLRQVGDFLHQ